MEMSFRSLSCWKVEFLSALSVLAEALMFWTKIEWHLELFIIPSTVIIAPVPGEEISLKAWCCHLHALPWGWYSFCYVFVTCTVLHMVLGFWRDFLQTLTRPSICLFLFACLTWDFIIIQFSWFIVIHNQFDLYWFDEHFVLTFKFFCIISIQRFWTFVKKQSTIKANTMQPYSSEIITTITPQLSELQSFSKWT